MKALPLLLLLAACDGQLCDPVSGRCTCPDYHYTNPHCVCRRASSSDPHIGECSGWRTYFDKPLACESTSEVSGVEWQVERRCVCNRDHMCTGVRAYGAPYLACEYTDEGHTPRCF